VCVANGSIVPIIGRASVRCTKILSLSPIFYVPNFLVNLLSVSSVTKSHNCRGWFDPSHCAFQKLGTGRILGTGTVHNGLYYLDEGSDEVVFASKMSPCQELLLLHPGLDTPLLLLCLVVILHFLMRVLKNLLYVMHVNMLNIQEFPILVWV